MSNSRELPWALYVFDNYAIAVLCTSEYSRNNKSSCVIKLCLNEDFIINKKNIIGYSRFIGKDITEKSIQINIEKSNLMTFIDNKDIINILNKIKDEE